MVRRAEERADERAEERAEERADEEMQVENTHHRRSVLMVKERSSKVVTGEQALRAIVAFSLSWSV